MGVSALPSAAAGAAAARVKGSAGSKSSGSGSRAVNAAVASARAAVAARRGVYGIEMLRFLLGVAPLGSAPTAGIFFSLVSLLIGLIF